MNDRGDNRDRSRAVRIESVSVHYLKRSDPEIVEGLLAGDPAAARAIVEKHGPSINARIWRMMGADSEHEDVVQQVFLAIFNSIAKLKDPQALQDWIGKITVNIVRNELRSRRMRRFIRLSAEEAEPLLVGADLEKQIAARRGFAILDRLPVEERILFILRFVEGAGLDEISMHTGHSVATVKRRLVKARDTFLKKAQRDPELVPLFMEEMRG